MKRIDLYLGRPVARMIRAMSAPVALAAACLGVWMLRAGRWSSRFWG
jgi:hypothetical protein